MRKNLVLCFMTFVLGWQFMFFEPFGNNTGIRVSLVSATKEDCDKLREWVLDRIHLESPVYLQKYGRENFTTWCVWDGRGTEKKGN